MAIQVWRPMSGLVEEMIRQPFMALEQRLTWWRLPLEELVLMPSLEIYEKDGNFVVRAGLPGMKKEEISVSIHGDTLKIEGEHKADSEPEGKKDYHRSELRYGKFFRTVTLPAKVRRGKVEARYEDGILEITLPKAAELKPKKIEVKSKDNESERSKST